MSDAPALPELDIAAVQAQADRVLADPLYWFGVTHHSPNAALHLRDAIRARRPKLLLIEGPAHASELIRHIVDGRTKPPVALYSSYRDDANVLGLNGIQSPAADMPARFAYWYPFLPYSPEYIALKEAKEIGADVVFMDLPPHARLKTAAALGLAGAAHVDEEGGEEPDEAEGEDEEDSAEDGDDRAADNSTKDETWAQLAARSTFYEKLAEVAGYKTWPECWDTLFEVGKHADYEAFRRDMAYFCAAMRTTMPHDWMATTDCVERERYMWQTIVRELATRKVVPEQAMVICGGYHLFMERDATTPPPVAPEGTVYTTVVPFSYFRTSELTGYGAGSRAPKFYQLVWDHLSEPGPESAAVSAMVEHVVAVLSRGRKSGQNLSSADAISVTQHARMLATLRGRQDPVLDDIRDALISCCVKGKPEDEGAELLEAMQAIEIGTAIGRVTPELGRLPLVHDFYTQIDDLDLGEIMGRDRKLRLNLDLRETLAARRSVFLHRLKQLDVGLGTMADTVNDGAQLFKEIWSLQWSPKVESELIEKNLYGDTIEAAATAMLDEELAKDQGQAGTTCERLLRAVNMDLPGLVFRMETSAGTAIDNDRRFGSLCQALTHLLVLDRLAAHRNLRRDVIDDITFRCFDRACFVIPDVAAVPEEEQREVMLGLKSLAEALLSDKGVGLDKALFSESVKSARKQSTVPYLQGMFSGILTEIREETTEELASQVAAYARQRPEEMIHAGEFLDGLLSVSKTSIMFGADALLGAIDDLLRAAEWDAFVTMLPRIRNAFERLHDRQRGALADRVAEKYGLREGEKLATLETSVDAALEMARIDARVAEIMEEWSF